jgi:hypothetical protein
VSLETEVLAALQAARRGQTADHYVIQVK